MRRSTLVTLLVAVLGLAFIALDTPSFGQPATQPSGRRAGTTRPAGRNGATTRPRGNRTATRPATQPGVADAAPPVGPAMQPVSITGEVLDMACYAKGKHGDDHAACALMCLKKGNEIGILTKDNKVYLVKKDGSDAAAIQTLIDDAAKEVTITADSAGEKDGKPVVTVKSAKGA